ncbi:MAG TPA: hypothetical protein VLK89_00210 [Solirubrobacterales bacterium]|nr:hypothetical protein [Solirubrobacterales bacterium]
MDEKKSDSSQPGNGDQVASWRELVDSAASALQQASARISRWVEEHREGIEQDSFLRRQVYGARGNAFRHGTALKGWRQKALSLTIALVACLDLMEDSEGALLVKAFGRRDRAHEITTEVVRKYQATPQPAEAAP